MGEDVESVMGGVRMGVNVDIKRTDGEYQPLLNMHTCDQPGHCFVMLSEHRQRPCVTLVFRRKKYLSDNTHNINLLTNKMLDVMMEDRVTKC